MPVTTPEALTDAEAEPEVQVPPEVASVRLTVLPAQMAAGVDGEMAAGAEFTVTAAVA